MNYIYRKMQTEDADSVLEMFKGIKEEQIDMSFAKITSKEEVLNFVDNPAELTYVVVSEDDPHRVLSLLRGKRDMKPGREHAAFLTAATHPDVRGGGLVGNLVKYSLDEMKKEGVNIARIYVYSDNTSSVNAVKKMDFTPAGSVLRHHKNVETGKYVDDLIFHKILD